MMDRSSIPGLLGLIWGLKRIKYLQFSFLFYFKPTLASSFPQSPNKHGQQISEYWKNYPINSLFLNEIIEMEMPSIYKYDTW